MGNELLDCCRVKKIFDKGFGFLTSLYFEEPVFFHFDKVKDFSVKAKLEKLQRGEVYFYYTSVKQKGRRKVNKLWFDIKDVNKILLPEFIDRIIQELYDGKINIFETAYIIKQLRENNFINKSQLFKILVSNKVLKTPSVLKAILRDEEAILLNQIESLNEDLESEKITSEEWADKILNKIYK